MGGQVVRAMPRNAAPITIEVDGEPVEAWAGESVLVAVLAHRGALRRLEFGNEPRAGFCLMGACQDCWIEIAGFGRTRACTTPVAAGMRILTEPPSHG
jgi:predicted molibdopterin-dependent oxidoreductase YjgC